MNLYPIIQDVRLSSPVEVEGSPIISVDEITYAKIIVRRYAVLTANFRPLFFDMGTNPQQIPDVQFPIALLVSETMESIIPGGVCYFRRTYAETPNARTERRLLAFSFPGSPAVYYSQKTGLPIAWDKYGTAPPASRLVLATVLFSYAFGPLAIAPALTKITYNGLEVDYCGPVYVPVGDVSISGGQTESRYQFQGFTDPPIPPATWLVAVNNRRWMGPIWETEQIQVAAAY